MLTQKMKDKIDELANEYIALIDISSQSPIEYVVEKILEEKEKEMKDKFDSIGTEDSTQREYGLGVKSGLRQAIIILRN